MEFQPLKYIYEPAGNPDAKTLLLLHGTGGDENDLLPLAKSFGTGFNILSLRGNVSENGMPRFFKRLGMGIFDEKDLEFRTDEMVDFIEKLAVEKGFDVKGIIALGYSNGANIAGATLVLHPNFLAGAILFRPMQPFVNLASFKNNSNVPVFFSSGKFDGTVDPEKTMQYLKSLQYGGFAVSYHEINTGHNLVQEDVDLAVKWFQEIAG